MGIVDLGRCSELISPECVMIYMLCAMMMFFFYKFNAEWILSRQKPYNPLNISWHVVKFCIGGI